MSVLVQRARAPGREGSPHASRRRRRPARTASELRIALAAWDAVVLQEAASAVSDHDMPSRAFAGTLLEMAREGLRLGVTDEVAIAEKAVAFARGIAADARRLR